MECYRVSAPNLVPNGELSSLSTKPCIPNGELSSLSTNTKQQQQQWKKEENNRLINKNICRINNNNNNNNNSNNNNNKHNNYSSSSSSSSSRSSSRSSMEITAEERASLTSPAFETIRDFCSTSLQTRLRGGDDQNYVRLVEQLGVLTGYASHRIQRLLHIYKWNGNILFSIVLSALIFI